jgi:hypothetical protein
MVTIHVLTGRAQDHLESARALRVSEGTVRCSLKRDSEGATDNWTKQPFKVEVLSAVIAHSHAKQTEDRRPVNVRKFLAHLVTRYGHGGSYPSRLWYMRVHHSRPRRRRATGGWNVPARAPSRADSTPLKRLQQMACIHVALPIRQARLQSP